MARETDPSGATPEDVAEEDIKRFLVELIRLFNQAQQRFGVEIGPVRPGSDKAPVVFETESSTLPPDRVRYRSDGKIITIVPWEEDFWVDGTEFSGGHVNTVIETPLPPTEGWQNAYIREGFILGGGEPFEYQLGVCFYTPEGMEIRDEEKAVLQELLPTVGQEVTNWPEIEDQMREVFDRRKIMKIAEMKLRYPELTAGLGPNCSPGRFDETLALLRGTTLDEEVGCTPNPFARQEE